jgi:xanthine dehydrogenase iron-sulfur cluster and FAD-binding subunit A
MSVSLALTVNGRAVTAEVDPRTLLVDYLRNDLGLTGTHVGCDTAQCGAWRLRYASIWTRGSPAACRRRRERWRRR